MADTYQPLVGIAATLIWTWRLKILDKDVHGLDVGLRDKQLFGMSKERLRDLSVDMSTPAILVCEGVKYPEGRGRNPECEPRRSPGFRLH